jgi:cystathionine beta-lyase
MEQPMREGTTPPSPDFDEILNRRASESFKWREYPADVLPLFVADMDFRSPEPVRRALQAYIDDGVFGYPRGLHTFDRNELPELPDIVVDRMAERYRWRITPHDLVLIPGVVAGLNLSCHTMAGDGGSVLVQTPVYPPILAAPKNAHLQRLDAPLARQSDGSYAVDWDAFRSVIQPDTRLFLLCNPHNPVGRVFRKEELLRMAEICLSRNVTICADEIHSDLLFSGHEHIPMASLDPEIARHTITLIAPSKTFNLAGLQCGFAIISNPELRQRFQAAREGLVPWVNAPGVIAAGAAYREGQPWLDRLLPYLEANRDFLWEFVRTELPGITMAKPEGTYLAWLDCRGIAVDNPYEFFLKHARVALNNGPTFGSAGAGFVRLNFGCPRATLEEALRRMKQALSARSSTSSL